MSVSYSEAGMNVCTFSWFALLLRLRRSHEPSNRPPGRPSLGEAEAGGHGISGIKLNDPPRGDKRTSKHGERSESQSYDGTILGILRIQAQKQARFARRILHLGCVKRR